VSDKRIEAQSCGPYPKSCEKIIAQTDPSSITNRTKQDRDAEECQNYYYNMSLQSLFSTSQGR